MKIGTKWCKFLLIIEQDYVQFGNIRNRIIIDSYGICINTYVTDISLYVRLLLIYFRDIVYTLTLVFSLNFKPG